MTASIICKETNALLHYDVLDVKKQETVSSFPGERT